MFLHFSRTFSFVVTVVLSSDLQMDRNELLRFFDIFKIISTSYKRRRLRTARRLLNTNVSQSYIPGNLSRKFLMQVYSSRQPVDSYQLAVINAKKRLLIDQVRTPYFTWAESNANEWEQRIFLICIPFGSCEVRHLNQRIKLVFS